MIQFDNDNVRFAFKLWCRYLKDNGMYGTYRFVYKTLLFNMKRCIGYETSKKLRTISQMFLDVPFTLRDEFYKFYEEKLKSIGITSSYMDYLIRSTDYQLRKVAEKSLGLSEEDIKIVGYNNPMQRAHDRINKAPWYINAMNPNRCRTARYNNYRR